MDPEEYQNWLTEHALRAGLTNPDLLKQANMLLPPEKAAADLKARFPGSFRESVRGLSEKKYAEARADMLTELARQQYQQRTAADLRRIGVVA